MSFVPAYSVVQAPGVQTTRTCFVLHGILGSGRNWRTFARSLCRERTDTRYILVDLRHHGASVGAEPPHTVTAAAQDLHHLATQIGVPDQMIGHSFGGKVALRYSQLHGEQLQELWVLDSRPGRATPEDDNEVTTVIRALEKIPLPLASRADVVPALTGMGFSLGLAQWMTTNLRREGDGYVWSFDLAAVRSLIGDYFELDLWSALMEPHAQVHIVRAEQSPRWAGHVLARFASTPPNVRVHTLRDSGHWVHVDNPTGLLQMMLKNQRS